MATWVRSCTPVKEGDKSPNFRKVKIESLVEFEWSIVGIPLVIDKLFCIQKVGVINLRFWTYGLVIVINNKAYV